MFHLRVFADWSFGNGSETHDGLEWHNQRERSEGGKDTSLESMFLYTFDLDKVVFSFVFFSFGRRGWYLVPGVACLTFLPISVAYRR
jgi:hypothetical protein